jgi:VanZ family protein
VSKAKRLSESEYETKLFRISSYLQSPPLRWALTLLWTAITIKLMFSPSGDGTIVSWVSKLFGGTETTDAIGHIIINTIQAWLWCWTINLYTNILKTTRIVLTGGIIWCFAAELTQLLVPNRGTSLLDLAANIVGVLIGMIIHRLISRIGNVIDI